MSKQTNLIMNILIIVLIITLVFVMMNYYTSAPSAIPNEIEVIQNEIIPNNNESIITNNSIIEKESGDKIITVSDSGEIKINSGENKNEDLNQEDLIENKEENSNKDITKNENKAVIMTSENEISNKEKKEVLTELDKTLMELLDVVDKVQTVDETRLVIDLSEVQ